MYSSSFVTSCAFHSEIHAISAFHGEAETQESLVIIFRHGTLAVVQYDSGVNRFRTVTQACLATEVELKPSSAFRANFCRVLGSMAVTQFTPTTLTLIQLGAEIASFTIPVKLKSALRLASIDDVQFVSSSGCDTVSLAVLGKSEPHAWVGRTSTIGSTASSVRLITVDMSRRSVSVNWSFDNLPTESFALTPLPKPRGGFLATSPDFVSYCEEFSSAVVRSVNAAGGDTAAVNYLHIGEEFDIDLAGARSIAISDELVLFVTQAGEMLGCHLVRQSGAFNTVSDLVWERLSIPEKIISPSSLALLGDAKLFVGSRQRNSCLFQLSKTEILLPIAVFGSSAEEDRLAELEQSTDAQAVKDLLASYQEEVHRAKISHSIELGLIDELRSFGSIHAMTMENDGIIAACGSGDLSVLSSHVPSDLVFELGLKDVRFVYNFTFRNHFLLALAGESRMLLIDCGNGLRELGRVDLLSPILGIVKTFSESDGVVSLITQSGVIGVKIVTSKQEQQLEYSPSLEFESPVLKAASVDSYLVVQPDSTSLIIHGVSETPQSIQLQEGREIVSFSPSVVTGSLHVTVADNAGSLAIYSLNTEGQLSAGFMARHASVCKAVLLNELNAAASDDYVLSITDPTKRPLEPNLTTPLFAEKIKIVQAKLVEVVGGLIILVMLIEGRPVLVYSLIISREGETRFVLEASDSVPILFEPIEKIHGYISETDQGIMVSVTARQSIWLSMDERFRIWSHPLSFGGFTDLHTFQSEYLDAGLVSLEPGKMGNSTLRILKLKSAEIDLNSRFPKKMIALESECLERRFAVDMVPSLPGLAVATVTEETDPGLVVPVAPGPLPQPEEDNQMMDDQFQPQIAQDQSTVLLQCPLPPKRQKHQVRIFSGISKETVSAIIALQPGEFVTGMAWADSVLGLGPDVLVIGTTFALGEETPCQGRVIVVRVNYAPGVTAPAVTIENDEVVIGGKILYESVKRAPVTIVKSWKGCVALGLAHRLMMYQWDSVAGRLRGVGMIDLGLQITSVSFFKNFIIAGDILRGVYLLRYKEDPVMDAQMNVISMAASIQQLAKSFPFQDFSAVKVDTLRTAGSVGIMSLDVFGNVDLELFSPVHFGQYLRHSVPFNVPSKCLAVVPIRPSQQDKCLLLGTANGALSHLVPVTESEHHIASSLVGLMVSLLPQPGGVNPKLHHVAVGREHLPNSLQAIESVDCLADFLYLATPLQAEIANRMKQPIDLLVRIVARWLTPVF
jgi:hypothetical protein